MTKAAAAILMIGAAIVVVMIWRMKAIQAAKAKEPRARLKENRPERQQTALFQRFTITRPLAAKADKRTSAKDRVDS